MLSCRLGGNEKEGGGDGGGGGGGCPRRAGAGGGRDRLVLWLAAASLVQLCALAAGGAWVLWRLQALEASHERLRAACAAAPDVQRRNGGRDSYDISGGGGLMGEAYQSPGGDEVKSAEKRSVWRRFVRASPSPSAGAGRTANESHPGKAAHVGRWGNVAHFELSNSSVNPGDFVLDQTLSVETRGTVMTTRGDHPYGGGSERWYPRIQQYHAASGRSLMYLSSASWLEGRPPAAQVSGLGEITVSVDGAYLIYAQICFMDSYPDFGFTIMKTTPDSVIPTKVASCELYAGRSDHHRPPNTCSVTTVHWLTTADSVTIRLIQSRRFNLRPDLSFIGLVRLE